MTNSTFTPIELKATSVNKVSNFEVQINRTNMQGCLQMVLGELLKFRAVLPAEFSVASNKMEENMQQLQHVGQPGRADLIVNVSVHRTTPMPEAESELTDIIFNFIDHPPANLMMTFDQGHVSDDNLHGYLHMVLTSMIPAEHLTDDMIGDTVLELRQQSAKAPLSQQSHGHMQDVDVDMDSKQGTGGSPSQQAVLKSTFKCKMEAEVEIKLPGVGFIVGLISAKFLTPDPPTRLEALWEVRSVNVTNINMLDYRAMQDEATIEKTKLDLKHRLQNGI